MFGLKEECTYIALPDGIHKLTLLASSNLALDQCFYHLDIIFYQADLNKPLLLLSDIRESGIPPIRHLWRHGRYLFERYPQLPPIYNAIVYRHNVIASGLTPVINQLAALYGAQAYFSQEETDAIRWLLER
jgi:hypothetical protein